MAEPLEKYIKTSRRLLPHLGPWHPKGGSVLHPTPFGFPKPVAPFGPQKVSFCGRNGQPPAKRGTPSTTRFQWQILSWYGKLLLVRGTLLSRESHHNFQNSRSLKGTMVGKNGWNQPLEVSWVSSKGKLKTARKAKPNFEDPAVSSPSTARSERVHPPRQRWPWSPRGVATWCCACGPSARSGRKRGGAEIFLKPNARWFQDWFWGGGFRDWFWGRGFQDWLWGGGVFGTGSAGMVFRTGSGAGGFSGLVLGEWFSGKPRPYARVDKT